MNHVHVHAHVHAHVHFTWTCHVDDSCACPCACSCACVHVQWHMSIRHVHAHGHGHGHVTCPWTWTWTSQCTAVCYVMTDACAGDGLCCLRREAQVATRHECRVLTNCRCKVYSARAAPVPQYRRAALIRGGAGGGDSVVSVDITFSSSHVLRYRLRPRPSMPSLRTAIFTTTAPSSL